jgi:hypothetical protein
VLATEANFRYLCILQYSTGVQYPNLCPNPGMWRCHATSETKFSIFGVIYMYMYLSTN